MSFEHTIELRVRYDECDPMGFVHHANYMKYFEIARTDLYRARGEAIAISRRVVYLLSSPIFNVDTTCRLAMMTC